MGRLEISLLGRFQVSRDGERVTRFRADTARALLAYLATRAGTSCRREALAGLLWPEQPDAEALRNLRVALSRLRDAIGDRDADLQLPHMQVTRKSLQFNPDSDYWIDVEDFGQAIAASKAHDHRQLASCAHCMANLDRAAALYGGDFLAGFSLDSAPFEQWLVVQRESLHLQALELLYQLAACHESRREYEQALRYARRQVDLEPWREGAHRQWMRVLALTGHRGAALAQYEACRRILAEELGVEPERETQELYERIRQGLIAHAPSPVGAPEPAARPVQVGAPEIPPVQVSPAPAQLEGERRMVTALSAAVQVAAAAGQGQDAEAWAEVVSQALGQMGAAVYRYGGEVSQLREDGLVALFGAAMAHEDDPERAVLAALAIGRAIQGDAADPVRREGIALRVRVGVNTGQAVVTRIGDRRQQQMVSAMGEAVSLAGHIASAAEPGAVFAGESTYRLVRPLFDWQSGGEIALKGARQRVAVYRPLAYRPGVTKPRGVAGLASPLVGRETELHALEQAIEGLRAGAGSIVTLVGDAGIGKSRLVAECRGGVVPPQDAAIAPPQWVEGRCLSYTTTVAYRLWVDVLRGLLGVAPDAAPDAIRDALREQVRALCAERVDDVYPYLGHMMSLPLEEEAVARLRGLDAESLRFLTFWAMETLVERAAGRRDLVLVCEDLHWADPTSLALLEHLLPLADRVPLLLVCVMRPRTDTGVWRVRETVAREYPHRHTDLRLDPLTEEESAELVGHLLHIEDLPRALRARVLGHTEGNPFYVEEILRSLIEGGLILRDEATGSWRATGGVGDLPIPDTLRGVLMARIDRLPETAKNVLRLASVAGRIFERRVLASIAHRERELDDDLVTLQRAQMIRQRGRLPEAAYIFEHQLTQEAAYDSLLRRKRRDLHRRVAQALERLYPERVEEQLGLLAYHWEQAEERDKAVTYLRRAGEQAAARYANTEAVAYLARALALTPEQDLAERYDLLLAREAVYNVQGAREAQHQDLVTLGSLTEALDDGGRRGAGRRAEVAVRLAQYAMEIADFALAGVTAQSAIRLAQAAHDLRREALAHLVWGQALRLYNGQFQAANAQLTQAVALARSASLRDVEADSLRELGLVVHSQAGEALAGYAEAEVYYAQSLHLYREMGNRLGEANNLKDIGFCRLYQGDYARARDYLERALSLLCEIGSRRDEAWARVHLGQVAFAQGDYAGSIVYFEQSLRIFREIDERLGDAWVSAKIGQALIAVGQYAKARSCLERCLDIGRQLDSLGYERFGLCLLCRCAYGQGDSEAARAFGHRALALLTGQDPRSRYNRRDTWIYAGHALVDLGCLDKATDAYEQALALQRELDDEPIDALAGLAHVALLRGDPAGALAHVEEGMSYLEARLVRRRYDYTEPFLEYLTCYRVLHANGDPRAQEVLDTAHRLLQERAAKISDEELRHSFLENVPAHREIAREFAVEYAQHGRAL